MLKLFGVMPALVTPFDAKAQIDFAAFEKHLTALRAAGVSGWVPCGSSGEYKLMSDDERDQVRPTAWRSRSVRWTRPSGLATMPGRKRSCRRSSLR